MSVEALKSWSGWAGRTVEVPADSAGRPTLLEVRGGLTSSFHFRRAVGGHSTGSTLVTTVRGRRMRVVLPADSSGFSVERITVSDGASGFHRWHARIVGAEALPALTKEEREGKFTETFGYFQPKRYYEERRVLRWEFESQGSVTYCLATGGRPVDFPYYPPRPKGTFPLTHHGYVTISSPDKWRVSLL
ncbi:hypothetical protein [Streptomyces cavourensis]|uniref:Uncharacterized protein n=1 Tax=Streptomyces cavourensis TaxID=67258 RepID=A0ABY5FIZ4_9ACTN|nr:hypothetical protein [Streptomyces cavourensis]UTR83586.1 hypothetical protein NLU04_34300 [Streptomyces cavourensis]